MANHFPGFIYGKNVTAPSGMALTERLSIKLDNFPPACCSILTPIETFNRFTRALHNVTSRYSLWDVATRRRYALSGATLATTASYYGQYFSPGKFNTS